ncbi:ABC transporter permease [Pseudochelatococcus contaminans]|uniref:Putative spermidine/putrescine transport system permease protein n=1 Tax=Pseudochelatococcus contaminans TaxID=1538103 RepID=A0A7W6EGD2_9HYPH|nr:ABC transporter permease subunit [Pseudochelatococcus contaminans]MBB3809373.1 putative spermidine/putrescine transport system permease protein [Pseudochelatococcus contaminans]
MNSRVSNRMLAAFATPGAALIGLFFLLPVGAVLSGAFAEDGGAFARLAADPVFWNGLRGTLILGTAAPLFSLVVGVGVALALARFKPGLRTATLIAISLPLTFSGLIVAYGFILLLGRAGFVTLLLAKAGFDPSVVGAFIYSPLGLGLAYSYYLIPRVVLIVLPAIGNFDRAQLSAARSLGAGRFGAFIDVMLPQIMPSLVAAFCLTAAVAIGAYGTALALVGTQVNILPLVLYSKISETGSDFPAAAAASLVLVAICVAVIAVGEAFGSRRRSGR